MTIDELLKFSDKQISEIDDVILINEMCNVIKCSHENLKYSYENNPTPANFRRLRNVRRLYNKFRSQRHLLNLKSGTDPTLERIKAKQDGKTARFLASRFMTCARIMLSKEVYDAIMVAAKSMKNENQQRNKVTSNEGSIRNTGKPQCEEDEI